MILSGTVTGHVNANGNQPPLFSVTVSGTGIAGGAYRLVGTGRDSSYLNSCCASVAIGDQSVRKR